MMKTNLVGQTQEAEGNVYAVRGLTKSLLGLPAIEQQNLVSRVGAISEQQTLNPTVEFPKLFTVYYTT